MGERFFLFHFWVVISWLPFTFELTHDYAKWLIQTKKFQINCWMWGIILPCNTTNSWRKWIFYYFLNGKWVCEVNKYVSVCSEQHPNTCQNIQHPNAYLKMKWILDTLCCFKNVYNPGYAHYSDSYCKSLRVNFFVLPIWRKCFHNFNYSFIIYNQGNLLTIWTASFVKVLTTAESVECLFCSIYYARRPIKKKTLKLWK